MCYFVEGHRWERRNILSHSRDDSPLPYSLHGHFITDKCRVLSLWTYNAANACRTAVMHGSWDIPLLGFPLKLVSIAQLCGL